MSDSDLQIGSHPNILQHIRDLVEFHAYMRNSESVTVSPKISVKASKQNLVLLINLALKALMNLILFGL